MYVGYGSYVAMSPLRKPVFLQTLSPENKADLVRTHEQRLLDANCERLTCEQIDWLEATIAFILQALYDASTDEEAQRGGTGDPLKMLPAIRGDSSRRLLQI